MPCSQAVCSIHLAALTIALERKKGGGAAYPVAPGSAGRKRSFLRRLPLIHLYLSINRPLIFDLTPSPSPLLVTSFSTKLQSGAGGRHGSAWCEAASAGQTHESVTCPHPSHRQRHDNKNRDKRNTHFLSGHWKELQIDKVTAKSFFFLHFISVETDSLLHCYSAQDDFSFQRLTTVRDELLRAESIHFSQLLLT